MRLVAYKARQGRQRIGALVDGDASVVNLGAAAAPGGQSEEPFLDMFGLDRRRRAAFDAHAIVPAEAARSER
jgi:hypothetical protein